MKLIIISGMSGSGKAVAAKAFEDMGFTVVDNMLPVLLPELVDKCLDIGDQPPADRLAVVVDTRSGPFFSGWEPAFNLILSRGVRPTVLFLDSSDPVLVQRFKETRRKHPFYDEHGGILVKANVCAVTPAMLFPLPYDHAFHHAALLGSAIRRCFLHRRRDHVTQAGVQPGMPAQRQDHLQAARAAVIGHVQNASHHHCHGCFSLFNLWFCVQPGAYL